MLGQDQFYRRFPIPADLRTVGIDHHSFLSYIVTGSNQSFFSLQFHYTDTAGRDFIDSFQIT